MKITAIVPVWNGRELLERLLASLAAQTQPADEVIVVDNGSNDGAPDVARASGAHVISMGRNAGFAAAVNRGVTESAGDWLAVLNSDVELAPDYLARLLAEAETLGAWFATGKLLVAGSSDRIDGTFDVLCRGGTACRVGSGRSDGPAFSEQHRVWSPPFTAALLRAELFRRVGLLETSFESYLEDVDFGLRCAALGLSGVYVPAAVAWHRGSATFGRWHPEIVRRMARNQILLVARHYPRSLLLRWLWPIVVAQLLWGLLAVRHGAGWSWLCGAVSGASRFLAARRNTPPKVRADPKTFVPLMEENERIIENLQTSSGSDIYWRLYLLLTGPGTK
jgi:GT2 family glycosyltransferase